MSNMMQEYLSEIYASKNMTYAFDQTANELFHDICGFMKALAENQDYTSLFMMRSDCGTIGVIENPNALEYTILWDSSYWDLYSCFCNTIFSLMHILDETRYGAFAEELRKMRSAKVIDFLLRETYSFFYKKYRTTDTRFAQYYKGKHEKLAVTKSILHPYRESIESVTYYSKAFVLLHECEHILTKLCPEVRDVDYKNLDVFLEWHRSNKSVSASDIAPELSIESYLFGLDRLVSNDPEWLKLKEELYGDMHAFNEMIILCNCNITVPPFSQVQNQVISVKLYNMFRTYISIIPEFIDTTTYAWKQGVDGVLALKQLRYNAKDIYYRQVLGHVMNCLLVDNYIDNGEVEKAQLDYALDKVESILIAYREYIQPLIFLFQNDLANQFLLK